MDVLSDNKKPPWVVFCYNIAMTLYTTKGDDGTTGLFGSKIRVSKVSRITQALGTLDELNAVVGICRAKYNKTDIMIVGHPAGDILYDIQQHLFTIQAELAGADKHISTDNIEWLEYITDQIEQTLAPITSFFLPGASELAAFVDLARTVARRAERTVVFVTEQSPTAVRPETLTYLNRLSSLLYAMVRATNDQLNEIEHTPEYQ